MGLLALISASETSNTIVQASYMLAALLFILGIKRLSRVRTAQSGNQVAGIAMLIAVVVTVWHLLGGGFDCGVGFASKGLGSAAAAGKGVVAGKVRGAIT